MNFHVLLFLVATIVATGFQQTWASEALVLTSLDWEPYVGSQLLKKGFLTEIVRAAYQAKSSRDLQVKFLPWERAVSEAGNGSADGYFPEYMSENVQKNFYFSAPIVEGPLVFYKRKGAKIKITNSVESLKPYRIGVVQGYVNTAAIDISKDLKKDSAPDDETNLRKLMAGRVDLIIIDRLVAENILRKLGPKEDGRRKVEVVLPVLEMKPLFICFPKNKPRSTQLLADFNEGLALIKSNGVFQKILKDFKLSEILTGVVKRGLK